MKYACNVCGREVTRQELLVKRVSFYEMGRGGSMVKQRTVAWICRERCISEDPAWNTPAFNQQKEQKKAASEMKRTT